MSRAHPTLLVLILCGVGACPEQDPSVDVPPSSLSHTQPVWADVVLQFSNGAMPTNCVGNGFPQCQNPPVPQMGPCANFPALGENDGTSWPIPHAGSIEVGFLCDTIIEVGFDPSNDMDGRSVDFVVWGNATPDSIPVVEVGDDGTQYDAVNFWPKNPDGSYVVNGGFQLETALRTSARFVRISNMGQGTINVDAVESVPRLF